MATRDEILRYVYEVEGDDDLKRVAQELESLGDASGDAGKRVQKFVDEIENIARAKRATEQFADLRTSVLELSRQYHQAKEYAEQLGTALAETDNPTKKQQREFEKARETLEKYGAQLRKGKGDLAELRSAFEAQGVDARKLGQAEEQLAQKRKLAVDGLRSEVKEQARAKASTEKLAKARAAMSRGLDAAKSGFRGLRGAVNSFGSSLLRITGIAGIVGSALAAIKSARVFGGAVDSAVELQRELTKTAALAGANAEQMQRLKEAANDVGAAYGVSAQETAQALTELVRASGDADAALAQLPATMQLAKAGGIELGKAATIVVQTLSQFNLAADQSSRVADVLAKTANDTTADITDLGEAFTYAAPVAAQLGLSIEDTAAAIGALSQQGFKGSMAGTALRQTFIQLLQPSSNFRQELHKLGIDTTDFNEVLAELAKRGDAGRNAILALGDRAAPAILALVNNGKTALNSLQVSLQDVQGEADRTAKSFTDNFAGAQGKLASALDKLRRSIVEKALGPIAEGFASAAVKIREFIDTAEFQKLTDAVKSFAEKGVKAVSEFIGSFDFAAATEKITAFVDGSGEKFSGLFADLKDAGDKVGTIFKVIGIAIDGLKAAVFGVATAVTGFVTIALKAFQQLAIAAKVLTGDLAGVQQAGKLFEEQIGGMNAVTEEFARRAIQAGKDIAHAFDKGSDSAEKSARSTRSVADATLPVIEKVRVLTQAQQQAARAQEALTRKQEGAKKKAEELEGAYQGLGIKSQAALEKARQSAANNLQTVNKAFSENRAKIEDVKRAFDAYAAAARAAVKDSSDAAKAQVESMLATKAALLGLQNGLGDLDKGLQGISSGFEHVGQSAGDSADEILNNFHAALENANDNESIERLGDGLKNAFQQGKISADQLADAMDELNDKMDSLAGGAAQAIAAAYNEWSAYFSQVSAQAVAAYQDVARAATLHATKVGDYLIALGDGATALKAKIAEQKSSVDELTERYTTFGKSGAAAFSAAEQSAYFTEAGLKRLIDRIDNGRTEFHLLGQQDLAGLRSAVESAISKVQQLKDEAKAADDQLKSIGASLQDQIDQINGNQADIENRRYTEQLEHLKELAKLSGDLNGKEYRDAIAKAEKLHRLKLQQLRDEAKATSDASSSSSSNSSRRSSGGGGSGGGAGSSTAKIDINLNGQNLKGLDLNDPAAIQQITAAVIQQIRRFGDTSL